MMYQPSRDVRSFGYVYVNNVCFTSKSKIEFDPGGVSQETVLGLSQAQGPQQKAKQASIEFDVFTGGDNPDIAPFMTGRHDITAVCNDGTIFKMAGAWLVASIKYTTPDEGLTIRFEGVYGEINNG